MFQSITQFFTDFFDKITAFFTAVLISLGIISAPVETTMVKITGFTSYNSCYAVEGGCTDGKYVYCALINSSVSSEIIEENNEEATQQTEEELLTLSNVPCRIIKIDLSSWNVVMVSEELKLDHANGMTYNSKTNKILIANNKPNYNVITVIDPDTLTASENHIFLKKGEEESEEDLKIYSISYVAENDCYYCGVSNSSNFVKLNSDFTVENEMYGFDMDSVRTTEDVYTRQSTDADENAFYSLYYKPNCIFKYNSFGECLGKMKLPVSENEAEFVFFVNGELYVCYNILNDKSNAGIIYKVENPIFTAT